MIDLSEASHTLNVWLASGIQILRILQNLPVLENARPPSLQAAFGENPKWQILESWVANSRKLGGKFSKVVESVENLLNLKNGFKSGFFEFQSGKFSKVITILRVAQNCEC